MWTLTFHVSGVSQPVSLCFKEEHAAKEVMANFSFQSPDGVLEIGDDFGRKVFIRDTLLVSSVVIDSIERNTKAQIEAQKAAQKAQGNLGQLIPGPQGMRMI